MRLIGILFTWLFFICLTCVVRRIRALFNLVVELKNYLKGWYYGRHEKRENI
jgi:hypothetical protein